MPGQSLARSNLGCVHEPRGQLRVVRLVVAETQRLVGQRRGRRSLMRIALRWSLHLWPWSQHMLTIVARQHMLTIALGSPPVGVAVARDWFEPNIFEPRLAWAALDHNPPCGNTLSLLNPCLVKTSVISDRPQKAKACIRSLWCREHRVDEDDISGVVFGFAQPLPRIGVFDRRRRWIEAKVSYDLFW